MSPIYSSHKQKATPYVPQIRAQPSIRLGNGSDWPDRAGELLLLIYHRFEGPAIIDQSRLFIRGYDHHIVTSAFL